MAGLLRYAYIDQHCNACGHSYAVTLEETLTEQRTLQTWRDPRKCEHCQQTASPLTRAIPQDALEQLQDAWEAVEAVARSAGFELRAGNPELTRQT